MPTTPAPALHAEPADPPTAPVSTQSALELAVSPPSALEPPPSVESPPFGVSTPTPSLDTSSTPSPRRSSRRGATKPPGFYARLHSGESASDYTAYHLQAAECSRLYGAQPTKTAGLTEVLNMIQVRRAAMPEDYRLLSPQAIRDALPSFLFYKAKDALPDAAEPPPLLPDSSFPSDESTSSWTLVQSSRGRRCCATACASDASGVTLRGRWVGGGHRQQRGEVLAERVAPTARSATHNILMAIAAFEGRRFRVGDIPSAYLQADHVPSNGK